MEKIAFVFPGQGSQTVGMGKEMATQNKQANRIFDLADETLGFSLSKVIFEGPQETLTLTTNAQPALLTTSVALLKELEEAGIRPDYTAGHSLGEYSALVASGALDFKDAVYTVRKRGEYMEEAVPSGEGTMAAVLGLDRSILHDICQHVTGAGDPVQLANLNCPGQIVISGTVAGVQKAGDRAKEAGAKRVLPLQVSGPFHSMLMKPAAEKFQAVLDEINVKDAEIPVVVNVTAAPETDSAMIRKKLIEQLYSPVLWEDTVEKLIKLGVGTFVEVGPGKVLSGLIRKVDRNVKTVSVQDTESLQAAVAALRGN
ncbi:ACP S-malonyltransferase [Siminovitchia sp. FSL H7-0308]|uniref:ACP S-malonyltransferase n=1 Tax=Siminovitchia sp. FSL H7-0308 TaxID=2921432 RepID=UPI0030ECA122